MLANEYQDLIDDPTSYFLHAYVPGTFENLKFKGITAFIGRRIDTGKA